MNGSVFPLFLDDPFFLLLLAFFLGLLFFLFLLVRRTYIGFMEGFRGGSN